ncbi:hypothetical protein CHINAEXTREME_01750 [Halobiforma lacisalsi AJ5]|uniref:Uncharacterized protein n=1 Tax=Natronobacterium lacisalsi AJ5 TaxID=358396 RepID=M0LJG9_NATLA|nr:hypothetical protein [Halobiforma lacisalsi]APW96570.1 hypothetical protein CHINAEXTREME_01750 [Halobiforma lacisalsi AJ5]EMA32150.1 hypothetical protein C445_12586 [Halobiforma lacisalsi AJ5]
MTALTPVVLLAGFCAAMSAVTIGRLLVAEPHERDPIDVGTALLVVSITLGTVFWAATEESWLSWPTRGVVAMACLAVGVAGLVVLARHWDRSPDGPARDDELEASDDGS